jgi:hypothetical protein
MSKYYRSTVTPVVGASAIYADGDRLGSTMTVVTGAAGKEASTLRTISLVDAAAQKSAMNVLFFSQSPTIASADNAALNLTDANMAYYLGHVAIAATDYVDSTSNAAACVKDINLFGLASSSTNGTIYAVLESGGTPTYATTSDLVFTFTFENE